MGGFAELEARFSTLKDALPHLRLDFQWGSSGEHWNLTGMSVNSDVRQLALLIEAAGAKLLETTAQYPELAKYRRYAPTEAWYWALKDLSREFRPNDWYAVEQLSGGQQGHIFTGRVSNVASASANLSLLLETRYPVNEPPSGDTYNIIDSQVGLLNTGQMSNVHSIDVSVTSLRETGQAELAEALDQLTSAIQTSTELDEATKSEALDQLEELSKQATLPPDKRSKSSVLRAIVASLSTTVGMAGGLAQVWTTWGPQIEHFVKSVAP